MRREAEAGRLTMDDIDMIELPIATPSRRQPFSGGAGERARSAAEHEASARVGDRAEPRRGRQPAGPARAARRRSTWASRSRSSWSTTAMTTRPWSPSARARTCATRTVASRSSTGRRPNGYGGLSGAVVAGMRATTGRWICVMDADLQHPPELIDEMLDLATGDDSRPRRRLPLLRRRLERRVGRQVLAA